MEKYRLLLVSLAVIGYSIANAQQDIPNIAERDIAAKSPNVAPMFNVVDCPVSYFNGTANISIPLCEVSSGNISIPITLSYSSTGLRPSQEASWVGLGWQLSLNASISRTVKHFDDFDEYDDFHGSNEQVAGYYNPTATEYSRMDHVLNNADAGTHRIIVRDAEPDIFCFSLWNGGGKFIFNRDSINHKMDVIFTDPSGGWKVQVIEFVDTDYKRKHYFEMTDINGNVYEFRKIEQTYTYGRKGRLGESSYNFPNSHYSSSWYLTKIKSASSRDSIVINYDDEYYISPSQESCYRYNWINEGWPNSGNVYGVPWHEQMLYEYIGQSNSLQLGENPYYMWSRTYTKGARIKDITYGNGTKISFQTSTREDMCYQNILYDNDFKSSYYPKKLDRITVHNSNGELVYDYEFQYDYFSGNGQNESYLTKRLKLVKIIDRNDPTKQHTMEYNEGAFPSKQTTQLDYWGYYNGMGKKDGYYCATDMFDNPNTLIFSGEKKYSSYDMTILGQLKSISYPTGGKQMFDYELNEFAAKEYVSKGGELIADNGSIIASSIPNVPYNQYSKTITLTQKAKLCFNGIIHNTNNSIVYGELNKVISVQNVSNGQIVYEYGIPGDFFNKSSDITLNTSVVLNPGKYLVVAHKSTRPYWHDEWKIETHDPSEPTYVQKSITMKGAGLRIKSITADDKVRHFEYYNGKLIITPLLGYKKFYYGADMGGNGDNGNMYFIQTSQSSRPLNSMANGYNLGYKTVKEIIDGNTTTYDYRIRDYSELSFSPDPSQMTNPFFENGLLIRKAVSDKYSETTEYLSKDAPKINAFAPTTGNIYESGYYGITWWYPYSKTIAAENNVKETYTYDDNLMIKSICRTTGGMVSKDSVIYTKDVSDPICQGMTRRNIVAPFKTIQYIDGRLSAGKVMKYRQHTNSMYLPDRIYDIKMDVSDTDDERNLNQRVTYDKYDSNGNPLQVTCDGIPSVYIWGYSNEYPVAEITNMTYQDLLKYITESSLTSIANARTLSSNQMTILANLQKSIATNRLCSSMTIYTYKPLVGITSQIAPNGLTTCYEYDSSGRLVQTSLKTADGNKQTLNKYKYNYKGVQK